MERGGRSPHQEGMERGGEGGRAPHREGTEGIGHTTPSGCCGWEWPAKGTRREISGLRGQQQLVKVLIRSLAAGELAVTVKFPQFSARPALP